MDLAAQHVRVRTRSMRVLTRPEGRGRSRDQAFDHGDLGIAELEALDVQVLSHVRFAAGAGEREHPCLESETEHDLRWSSARALHDALECGPAELARVRGEQRESLVRDSACGAEGAHGAIPPCA